MFPKDSAFSGPAFERGVRELFRKTEAAIHEQEHQGDVLVPNRQLEEWYASLNEIGRSLDLPREHVVAADRVHSAADEIERLRDQVYSYLRG